MRFLLFVGSSPVSIGFLPFGIYKIYAEKLALKMPKSLDKSRLQLVKEGGVLLRRSAFFFCIREGKEEKAEKNRQEKSAAMSARRAF